MENLRRLNGLSAGEAEVEWSRCCGASRWAKEMAERRPFQSVEACLEEARRISSTLTEKDWLEAFSHHPKIGDKESLRRKFASTRQWAAGEQFGVREATEEVLEGLARGNRAYEEKFGFIFIVCASGKSAEEMLSVLETRLKNDKERELRLAAKEQEKITEIRIRKILED